MTSKALQYLGFGIFIAASIPMAIGLPPGAFAACAAVAVIGLLVAAVGRSKESKEKTEALRNRPPLI